MKAKATQSNAKSDDRTFEQVYDRQRNRVRGLWQRDDKYYARLDVDGITKRIMLHGAKTVAEAETARQVLKDKIASGTYQAAQAEKVAPSKVAPSVDHSLTAAIDGYKKTRDNLGELKPASGKRENSGLNFWLKFAAIKKITTLDQVDKLACLDFSEWRRDVEWVTLKQNLLAAGEVDPKRPAPEELLAGRSLDVDVQAIKKVLEWGEVRKWIDKKPEIDWDKLAKPPEVVRLLTSAELDELCSANLIDVNVAPVSERDRVWRLGLVRRAQLFGDYLRLIFYSGARETEMLKQKWSNVTWSVDGCLGRIFFPGVNAKAGAGKPAADRHVDFHTKLEDHLRAMYARRDKSTDWMFPSNFDPLQHTGSFRKQLEHAREITGQPDVGFHHGRHYFISFSVAAGVDFKTIAIWVSHRGTELIGRKYAHLVPGQGSVSAAKLNAVF